MPLFDWQDRARLVRPLWRLRRPSLRCRFLRAREVSGLTPAPAAGGEFWREASREHWARLCDVCVGQTSVADRVRRYSGRTFSVRELDTALLGLESRARQRSGVFWQAARSRHLRRLDLLRLPAIPTYLRPPGYLMGSGWWLPPPLYGKPRSEEHPISEMTFCSLLGVGCPGRARFPLGRDPQDSR